MLEKSEGILEKIRFYNEDNGYLVGSLRLSDGTTLTIVGNFPPLQEGENLIVSGSWQVHNRYGKQLAVEQWERLMPATEAGLKRYLASGLIKGIGPVTAEKIVGQFGLKTLEMLEKEPQRLQEIEGIGTVKAAGIIKSYSQYKDIQNVLVFLQGYGVGIGQAMRLYRRYGSDTVQQVKENPYRMAEDVFGIGFKTADKIARQFGLPEDAPERVQASITYTLSKAAEQGHVYLPGEELLEKVRDLLDISGERLQEVIFKRELQLMVGQRRIFCEPREEGDAVYYAPFYQAEQGSAHLLKKMSELAHPGSWSCGRS